MISSEMRDTIDHAKLYMTDPETGEKIPFHEKSLDFGELMQRELDGEPMWEIPFMPTVTATATVEIPPETLKALNGDPDEIVEADLTTTDGEVLHVVGRQKDLDELLRQSWARTRKRMKNRRPVKNKRRRK